MEIWDGKSPRNLNDKGATVTARKAALGTPEWEAENAREVAERPKPLPLDQRAYPFGEPDHMKKAREARERAAQQ